QQYTGPPRPPTNAVSRKAYIQNGAPCKIRTGRTKNRRRLWQKCPTRSFSDSRLLRKARVLRYLPASRSARIVVTPLHESPGPATAGASLFWPHQVPALTLKRPGPSPTVRTLWSVTDLTKRSVRCYHCRRGKMHGPCELRIGRAVACRRGACRGIATRPSVGEVASDVFGAGGQIAKASSDPARNDFGSKRLGDRIQARRTIRDIRVDQK